MNTPDFTLVQLTDTHIRAAGEKVHGRVDTLDNLRSALQQLSASEQRVDALVLSGDLTDNGDRDGYRRLRDLVVPAAETLGAQLIYAMGNHDERHAFLTELMPSYGVDPAHPIDTSHITPGMRIIVLDSTTPGRHDGELDDAQLTWLTRLLRTPHPVGTILVLHHPPIPSPVVTVDHLRLQNAERLESAVAGSDVRMILCGHAHHTGCGAIAGIPVWVGPALSYRVDTVPPAERHRGLVGFGFTRVDVFGGTVVATAVECTPTTVVYDDSRVDVLARLAALSHQAR